MKVNLFHAPIHKGQLKKGVELAPRYLVESFKSLQQDNIHHYYPPPWAGATRTNFKELDLPSQCKIIHDMVLGARAGADRTVILGGDHSISIGSIGALLKQFSDLSVIWIDAHGDINTRESSPSGNVHGQPVSYLLNTPLGEGTERPDEYNWLGDAKLKPNNLLYIGLRDLEQYEWDKIHELGIKYIVPEELNTSSAKNKISKFIHDAKSKIHISFDIDAVCSEGGISTGTPVKNGITEIQLDALMKLITHHAVDQRKLHSLDVVEFNHTLSLPLQTGMRDITRSVRIVDTVLSQFLQYYE